MRYQQAAALEKMRFEQEELNERKRDLERYIQPVKVACEKEYESARAWFDPIGNSLGRIKLEILERENHFMKSSQSAFQMTKPTGTSQTLESGPVRTGGVTFQIYSSADSNLHGK